MNETQKQPGDAEAQRVPGSAVAAASEPTARTSLAMVDLCKAMEAELTERELERAFDRVRALGWMEPPPPWVWFCVYGEIIKERPYYTSRSQGLGAEL